MAAQYEFSDRISCTHGLSWSKDQRIAFCTDTSVKILTLSACTDDINETPNFDQSFIPVNEKVWNISELSDEDYKTLINTLSREDLQRLTVDKILNPFQFAQNSLPLTGFHGLAWSPLGADHKNRSILATVSHDYRLCLYTQKSSKFDWYKIADLTEVRHEQSKKSKNFQLDKSTVQAYVRWCYSQAVVAVSWYPKLVEDKDKNQYYGILAAAVKSGEIVLWRVNMPCTEVSQCTVITTVAPKLLHPNHIFWDEYTNSMLVCYVDGTIYGVVYDGSELSPDLEVRCLWQEEDLMLVSSFVVLPPQKGGGPYLLFTKESMVYLLQLSETLEVLSQTSLFGDHMLPVSDICQISELSYLAMTLDEKMFKLQINYSTNGASVSMSELQSLPPTEMKYMYMFGCSSPNRTFLAFVVRPWPGFDHLHEKNRFPTKLHICPLSESGLTTDEQAQDRVLQIINSRKGILQDSLDVLVAFKLIFLASVDLSLVEEAEKDIQFDIPQKIKRICLKQQILKMKEVCNFKETPQFTEILQSKEEQFWATTYNILFLNIEPLVEKIEQLQLNSLNETETGCVGFMLSFLLNHQDVLTSHSDYTSIVQYLQQLSKEQPSNRCCICNAEIKLNKLQWKCQNGHSFGACCRTLAPCDDIGYIACSTCHALSQSPDMLADIRWLDKNSSICTLCDGLCF